MGRTPATAAISASRQKNCNACVQAKRRCDKRMPICSRCVEKNVACVYAKARATIGDQIRNDSIEVAPYAEYLQFGGPACSIFSPGLSPDVDYFGIMPMDSQPDSSTTKSLHDSVMDADINGDTPMDPFLSLLDNSPAVDKDQSLVPVDRRYSIDRPRSPVDEGSLMAYEKMAPFCEYLEPWQLHDPTTQLYYLVNRVKAFTSDAAARNSTPFMHRRLYTDHTPPCILDCFTTNVLYTNRNPSNMAMVMRALYRNVGELVGAEAGRVVGTPAEKLARTQALFLYQIIRLFDGDVTLRTQGEQDIPLLRAWLGDLCRVRENLGDITKLGDNLVKAQPPKEWKRWVFAESVRRTIIMAYSVLTLYGMMKSTEKTDDADTWEYTHRWTLSRHLWEADSSSSFYRMWKEKPHYIISNFSLEDFLKYGRGDDVDEFAEILLNGYVGLDETKEFMSSKEANGQ